MGRKMICCLFLALSLSGQLHSQSEADSLQRHIALFLPLYLDSAFDGVNYRFKDAFPKFLNAGLEFYEGAQLALDTLAYQRLGLDIAVYDTRSKSNPVSSVLASDLFQNTELIIGHVGAGESRMLARAALQKNIPFVNVNLPNNSGITENPELVLLNTTLKTHCETLYRFLQKNFATSVITYFYDKTTMSANLKKYFTDIEHTTKSVPLDLKFVMLSEPLRKQDLAGYLDSSRQNILIAGSLSDNFSRTLCTLLATLGTSYAITIFGMPTWDNIDFTQPEYHGLEVYYGTPFYSNPNDTLVKLIQQNFKNKFYSRPSDLVFRGYATMYHFAKLLSRYRKSLGDKLSDTSDEVLDSFDLEPVFVNQQQAKPDYFENKKVYFVKKVDGNVTAVY